KVEAPDKYTVKFTLKEPYVWFLEMLANSHAVPMIAKECVEKFGDLKKPESAVGSGPWMLDNYRPNVGYTFVRNPGYFVTGQPYIDRIEVAVDEDNASRMAAFIAGKYDLGWEYQGVIARTDWLQMRDTLKQRRPRLQTVEYPNAVMQHISMRTDKAPFSDVRVRRAMSLAINRQAIIDAVYEGVGVLNPPVPAALKEWSVPMDQLGEGAQYYKFDPAERLLRRHRLDDLRLPPRGRHRAARGQAFEGRGHRRQAEPEGIRRVHLQHLLRQVRLHGLRSADRIPGARQLPLRPVLSRRAQEPEPHQRPGGGRHARAPAAHAGRGQAA